MKRLSFGVAILLCLLMINTIAEAQGIPKVLLLASELKSGDIELMLVKEVAVMVDMLQKAGFKVVVADFSGKPIEGPVSKLNPDLKISEVKVDDYAGFMLPCMAPVIYSGFGTGRIPPDFLSIAKQAVTTGKPVAAAHDSVFVLAEAGVLEGKRYALSFDPTKLREEDRRSGRSVYMRMKFGRAIYGGSGIVQDGNIITSGICPHEEALRGVPDRTLELTRAFIEKLRQKRGK